MVAMTSTPPTTASENPELICGTGMGPIASTPDPESAWVESLKPINARMAARPADR
jgi:hypothetical protein